MRLPTPFVLLLLSFATWDCKRSTATQSAPSKGTPDAATVRGDAPVDRADAGAGARAGVRGVDGGTNADQALALHRYRDALAAGRRETRDHHYEQATNAFSQALEERPDDARALAERGYAQMLSGANVQAEQDFARALSGGVDRRLSAQIFFNLGDLRAKSGNVTDALSAYSIANTLVPSKAAAAKLYGHDACGALIERGGAPLGFFADFDAVEKHVEPDFKLGSAKDDVCIQAHTTDGEGAVLHVCDGSPPWILVHHHLLYTEVMYIVGRAIGRAGLWLYDAGTVGGWPAHCSNYGDSTASIDDGQILHVLSTFDGSAAAPGDDFDPMSNPVCNDVLGHTEHILFNLRTGARLVRIFVPTGAPEPKLTVSEGMVHLRGAGCDRDIPIDGVDAASVEGSVH